VRSGLAAIVVGGAVALSSAGFAQTSDDGPIATAPGSSHQPIESQSDTPPPEQSPPPAPYQPPPPAAYQPPPRPSPPPAEIAAEQSPAGEGAVVAYATFGKRPAFLAETFGNDSMAGPLSVVGAAAALRLEKAEGERIVTAAGFDDPAPIIAREFAEGYAAARGARLADAPVDGDAADDSAGGARYLVKVQTHDWGFVYYALDWTHYRLTYDAHLELIDTATHAVVAKGVCAHKADPVSERFTYNQLTGDGGAMLKSQLKAIANECVAQFKAEVPKS
jgi:hypothetical protein